MYETKTLLDLAKTVRFEVEEVPTSRRSAIMSHQQVEIDMTEHNETSRVRHRKQPSMDLIRQLPSRNLDEGNRTASLHSRNSTRKRKVKSSLLTYGTIGVSGLRDIKDEDMAEKIYVALRDEIDGEEDVVDAEKLGTSRLRDMKHSLNVKRMVRSKLGTYQNDKPKKIGWIKKVKYHIGMTWSHFKNTLREMGQHVQLWHRHIHTVEGHFGSGVVTFFLFLRYLFYLNVFLQFSNLMFIFIPQELYRFLQAHAPPYPNVTFSGLELLTGTGWFVGTELYYSGYTNNSVEIFNSYSYNMPEAYLYTFLANSIVILIVLAYGVATSYKRNFLVTSESISRSLPVKVFCGWDHQIASEDAAELKHNSLFNEISVMASSLNMTSVSNDCCVKFGNYAVRFFINFMIIGMLIITGLVLFTIFKNKSLESDVPIIREMVVAFVATFIMVLFPLFCSFIVEYEQYESHQTALYLTVFRSFLMQLVILGILFDHLITLSVKEWRFGCWENVLGQEMYRLLVLYFISLLVVTLISDWIRKIVARFCIESLGKAEFNTAVNVLSLIYIQTLCWLGNFFSPLLTFVTLIIIVVLFYAKRYSTEWNCRPSRRPWAAANAQTVFLSLTLISFLLTSAAVGYIILFPRPSDNCGPFCHQDTMYSILLHVLHNLITIQVVGVLVSLATNPVVVGGILLLMIILVHYLRSMSKTYKEMTERVRQQLILESKDKVFLLHYFETAMARNKSSKPQHGPLKPEDRKVSNLSLKDLPGVSAITTGIAHVSSGVSQVGSKVGESVLKLKNVVNPMYRDQSRKDRETKSDPTDRPPLRFDLGLQPEESPSKLDPQSPSRSVVTPPAVQHLSGWDRKRLSSPGAMTPDRMRTRNSFSRSSPKS